jgi:hypothetical protein
LEALWQPRTPSFQVGFCFHANHASAAAGFLSLCHSSTQSHLAPRSTSNLYGPELLGLDIEVRMATDSSFQDRKMQGSVPPKPESDTDTPSMDPERPGKYDPLGQPDEVTRERPEDWKDPADREMPAADEQSPLSDDRR